MEKATKAEKERRWMADDRLIPLEDDCMFAAVMGNRDACTGFLEALFGGRKIRDVRFVHPKEGPEVQRHMVFNPGGKSIRMDVYFEDSDAVYDIELQRTDEGDLPRRARMYSSYMDTGILGKGMDYRSLRDSYVIFVCRFDPFRLGEKLYHFETVDRGHEDLQAKDGRHIIFLNTKGTIGELGPDMEALFSYLNGGADSIGMETGSSYVDRLDGYVQELNQDEGWRIEHMKYELSLAEKYREGEAVGRSEGFSQGEAIGLVKGRSEGLSQGEAIGLSKGIAEEKRRMVKSFKVQGFPIEAIAKASSLSIEEVKAMD